MASSVRSKPGVNKYFVLILCIYLLYADASNEDTFSEELFMKKLPRGHVLSHFQFTTLWNSSLEDPATFTYYRLFPKGFGDVLNTYHVQELHLSLTQGLWNYEHWGYPPEDAPPGVELWVWFQKTSKSIDQDWAELVNALSGLFCSSLNFMDEKATVVPRWSFRPAGLASEYYSFDSRFMRYSALPREVVCTENLTPWEKLLPCESQVGLASLFNPSKLYDSTFHSLSVHVRPVCQGAECTEDGIELKQTLTAVYDTVTASNGFQDWSLKRIFGRPLYNTCPLADTSKLYVDTKYSQREAGFQLVPSPDEVQDFTRGRVKQTYAVYDLKKQTEGGKVFNLDAKFDERIQYGDVTPPPLYAHRYVTGYGLEKGGITCVLYNTLDTNLTVIYMETIPWYLRLYFSSIKIRTNNLPVKPYKTHFIPSRDRSNPSQLEMVFRLRPNSETKISMEFDRAFLKWTEYPPDANHGFYVNSAVITTLMPSGEQYTATQQSVSTFGESMSDESSMFFIRMHTESLLVSLPTPDFSMPYNVICLACTVVAIAFGSLHNLTTRSFVTIDPDKQKPNLFQKLKNKFKRKNKDEKEDGTKEEGTNEKEGSEEVLKEGTKEEGIKEGTKEEGIKEEGIKEGTNKETAESGDSDDKSKPVDKSKKMTSPGNKKKDKKGLRKDR